MGTAGIGAVNYSDCVMLMATDDVDHLDESALAGFLDDDLAPQTRDRVIVHLEACAECRRELRSISELAASLPARRVPRASRRGWWITAGGLVAASLVGVATIRQPPPKGDVRSTARGRAVLETSGRIDVVSPAPTATGAVTTFIWRPASVDTYRFTLLSDSGSVLFIGETSDTTLALPREVKVVPGVSYFWRVDGVAGTIAASTGARRLRLMR